jgi:hypothetical protein
MRIMRFTILSLLTLLILAIAIPAAASTCSSCIQTVTVSEDGTSQITGAECELNANGDIPNCRAFSMRRTADCVSVDLIASCGEGGGNNHNCPPWGCIQYVKARRMRSMIRPILSAM